MVRAGLLWQRNFDDHTGSRFQAGCQSRWCPLTNEPGVESPSGRVGPARLLVLDIEADAPVLNLYTEAFVVPGDSQQDIRALAMATRVVQQFQHNGQDRRLQLGSQCVRGQIVAELDRGAVADLTVGKQANKCRAETGGLRLAPQRDPESQNSTVVVGARRGSSPVGLWLSHVSAWESPS